MYMLTLKQYKQSEKWWRSWTSSTKEEQAFSLWPVHHLPSNPKSTPWSKCHGYWCSKQELGWKWRWRTHWCILQRKSKALHRMFRSLFSSRNIVRKLQQKWPSWERIKWFLVTCGFRIITLRLIGLQEQSKWLGVLDMPYLERETPFCSTGRIRRMRFSSTYSCLKQEESALKTDSKPIDLVPWTYHQYLKVFSKKESERMPIRNPWDHAIHRSQGNVQTKERTTHTAFTWRTEGSIWFHWWSTIKRVHQTF